MLIVMGGLSGTGKTSVSRGLAQAFHAVHLRIDTIEQALVDAGAGAKTEGPAGYMVGYALAADNLRIGLAVVADSVNPLRVTRDAWRAVAQRSRVPVVEVEVICSDSIEHQRRVESRTADIEGLALPSWQEILRRDYEPWDRDHIVIDTSRQPLEACVREAVDKVRHAGRLTK